MRIRRLPSESAFAREIIGDRVDWSVDSYLLARVAHLLAAANWQRGGGKGGRPKPIPVPDSKPRRSPEQRAAATVSRLRNLGLVPAA